MRPDCLVAYGERLNIGGLDGDHVPGILDYAFDLHVRRSDTGRSLPVEKVGIDDDVHDAGFIFEAQEDESFGSPRSFFIFKTV